MSWAAFTTHLFALVSRVLGPLGAAALALARPHVLHAVGDDDMPNVVSLDDLKKLITGYLTQKVTDLVGNPVVAALLNKVIASLTDGVLEEAWQWLHEKGHVEQSVIELKGGAVAATLAPPKFEVHDAQVYDEPLWQASMASLKA